MTGFDSTRDALSQGIVAAILVGVFALLAADRVHRVLIPIGAVAIVWLISYFTPFRLISFEAAKEAVDLNVILLLFSMMALVGVLKTTNVFPWVVDRLLERSRGNPSRAARLIIWFTGVLSAILDNVTTVIFLGFMTHTFTHMQVAVPAVIGIAAILFAQDYYYLKEHKPTLEERRHGVLDILEKDIEWPTLAFFLFLFILVGAAVATGLIESLAHALAWIIDSISKGFGLSPRATLLVAALLILWVSGFLSAIIDNIPYTAVTIPLVASLLGKLNAGPDGQILWWALALGACLGGNGTLIGASANVTVTGLAEKDGKRISFNEFTAFGSRVAGITLLMSSVYLAMWLYIGSTLVNVACAVVLIGIFAMMRFRRSS